MTATLAPGVTEGPRDELDAAPVRLYGVVGIFCGERLLIHWRAGDGARNGTQHHLEQAAHRRDLGRRKPVHQLVELLFLARQICA